MRKLLFLTALAAALKYFFDPQQGRRRRAEVRGRLTGFYKRGVKTMAHPGERPDDVTLAHKVETEIFRDPGVPKGQINVNAENGKVYLRGQVDQPELIRDLEERTRKVHGVADVENLLHLPPPPSAEAPTPS